MQTNESRPERTLAGHFLGAPLKSEDGFGMPAESYGFPNKKTWWETIPPLLDRASPLRTSHLRDPLGPQIQFASESFMDELAHAVGVDPVEFRLKYVRDPRDIAVIKAAAEKSGWKSRPSPNKGQSGNTVTGRGIAYAFRNGTIAGHRRRGGRRALERKDLGAQDHGRARLRPDHQPGRAAAHASKATSSRALSRTIWEEVQFDSKSVTSVDWANYPIFDIVETPQVIDCVLIDRPERRPTGAGEGSIRPIAAAIANAVFDATGVRIRRAPLTPDRVRASMS